jgi:hypothetical protein
MFRLFIKKILKKTTLTNQATFDLNGGHYVSYRDKISVRAYNDNFSMFFQAFAVQIPIYWKPSVAFGVPSNLVSSNLTDNSFTISWDNTRNSQASEIRLWNANGDFSKLEQIKTRSHFTTLKRTDCISFKSQP